MKTARNVLKEECFSITQRAPAHHPPGDGQPFLRGSHISEPSGEEIQWFLSFKRLPSDLGNQLVEKHILYVINSQLLRVVWIFFGRVWEGLTGFGGLWVFGRIKQGSYMALGFCLLEVLEYQFNLHTVTDLLGCSLSSWLSFGTCILLGIYPFVLGYPSCWYIISYDPFNFCVISCNISFISDYIYFSL